MGVKNLMNFLRKRIPQVFYEIPIDAFYAQRIAIDTSVFLYKYICLDNGLRGNWIDYFIQLIQFFKRHNIHPVFVFDGKPPNEKLATKEKRNDQRKKLQLKIERIETILDDLENSVDIKEISELLGKDIDTIQSFTKNIIRTHLETVLYKLKSQCIYVTSKHVMTLKRLLSACGVHWIQAPDEAERFCAFLAISNKVSAVLSVDSDVLVYGTPIFIHHLDIEAETVKVVCYQDILQELQFTHEQFVDFSIMCGTDYNTNIAKIGPMKSFELIDTYICIERIPLNTDILCYKKGRALFQTQDLKSIYSSLCFSKLSGNRNDLFLLLNDFNSQYTTEDVLKPQYTPTFEIIND
jgi:5'-3' exonuclease